MGVSLSHDGLFSVVAVACNAAGMDPNLGEQEAPKEPPLTSVDLRGRGSWNPAKRFLFQHRDDSTPTGFFHLITSRITTNDTTERSQLSLILGATTPYNTLYNLCIYKLSGTKRSRKYKRS